MKTKIGLAAILFLFGSGILHAQSSFFVSGGYGFSLASDMVQTNYTERQNSPTILKNIHGSYGAGFSGTIGYTKMLTDNFGIELGTSYKRGSSIESQSSFPITTIEFPDGTGEIATFTKKIHVNYLGIMPAAVIKSSMNGFAPYAKFGFIFAFPKGYDAETLWHESADIEYTGPMAFGYTGTVGAEFVFWNTTLFAELRAVSLSWKVTDEKLTSTDKYAPISLDSGTTPNLEGMNTNVNWRLPLSSVDINIGVKVQF